MMQFASLFPDIKIVTPLVTQLSWTHFLLVMPIKDPLAREFYLTMAANERWGKRTLEAKIDGLLYERTAVATKPDELIKQELSELRENNVLTPDLVFKSPCGTSGAVYIGVGQWIHLCRAAEAYDYRRRGLLPRPAFLPSQVAPSDSHRFEARQIQGAVQRTNGAVPALARSPRDGAWRGAAP